MATERTFHDRARVVLVAVAIAFVLVAALTAAFGTRRHDRVEGVAERWMNAVSDVTRKGVGGDARRRVAAHGDAALLTTFVHDGVDHQKKSVFSSLEVGRALVVDADRVLVPVKAVYRQSAEGKTLRASLILRKARDSWRVVDVGGPKPGRGGGGSVPSDGGPSVARAPVGLYAGTLVVVALVTLGATALIGAAQGDAHPATA